MVTSSSLVNGLWLIFAVYWLVAAFGTKRTASSGPWWGATYLRIALIIVALQLLRLPFLANLSRSLGEHAPLVPGPVVGAIGAAVCFLGIAFAIWARVHLGRNWGVPMSLREGHELVTTGPYTLVRHPIYTGILFAMFGSMLAEGVLWLVAFVVFFAYFVYSAKAEETLMSRQFPNEYPEYASRTKMLIPFVL